MLFRFLFLFIVLGSIDLYAFQSVRTVAQNWSPNWRMLTYAIYWAVPVFLVGYMVAYQFFDGASWNKGFTSTMRALFFLIYIAKFFVAAIMMLEDIQRLARYAFSFFAHEKTYMPSRSAFLAKTGLFIGLLPLATLTYGMLRNRYRYQVRRVKVPIANLPKDFEGLRIVQISDIHSGTFTDAEPLRAAIDMIHEEKPDIVFFTGDLVNSRADEMKPFIDVFDKIRAPHGVFSILGNHDYGDYDSWNSQTEKAQNFTDLVNTHERLGWKLLRNENQILEIGQSKLAILGVENYSALPQFHKYGDLVKTSVGTENADLRILLSHDPTHWESQVLPDHKNIPLTLSGHTHGFQFGIEIPGFLRWSPSQYMYKQWGGLYTEGGQHIYVNRGFGMLGYPGRVGILPEITLLELVSA